MIGDSKLGVLIDPINQISDKTEMFSQTNYNQISHKTFKHEIFNQTKLNQISHTSFNSEISYQTN